jgi:hypothetical protein
MPSARGEHLIDRIRAPADEKRCLFGSEAAVRGHSVLEAIAAYDHGDRIIPDIVASFVATKRGEDTAMVPDLEVASGSISLPQCRCRCRCGCCCRCGCLEPSPASARIALAPGRGVRADRPAIQLWIVSAGRVVPR